MSDKLIGKTIAGRFVLEEVLGTGATGSVYRAQQTSVDRIVAVKTLHPFLQEREDFKARFEIEAKAIARLNHPNCITLYDFGYDADFDVFYMAVEYIKGSQLADLMGEVLPIDDVLSIAYQVTDALEHAHREGILHRDLKPENIMIEEMPDTGRLAVKVLDFGLARLYEAKLEKDDEAPSGRYRQITEAGQVYGTPAYMSPEQCRGKSELTPATDIYALGTMLFELLEGQLPFFSKSTAELILMQMTEDPPAMTRLDVPLEIRGMVHRMMAKDPTARPQSAKEVLVTLLSFVRLDASQEFRILPTTSGEFKQLTPAQIRVLKGPTSEDRARPELVTPLDLSNDELRAAQTSNKFAVVAAVIVGLLALAGAAMVLTGDTASMADASPALEETVPPAVADPVEMRDEAATGEPLEVAKVAPPAEPDKKVRKRARAKKATSESPPVPEAPVQNEADRAKTLKLTY